MNTKKQVGRYNLLPCAHCGEYPSLRLGTTTSGGWNESETRITIKCKCGISLCKSDRASPPPDEIWNGRVK